MNAETGHPTLTQPALTARPEAAAFGILLALSFSHLLNDTMQSLIQALYPMIKDSLRLDYTHIGFITLAFQLTASLLQPVVGLVTDRKPMPYSLPVGMGFTLIGLAMLSVASSYPFVLTSAAMIGLGSSVFHPESARVARRASGGRYGTAQSLFQVGGNAGSAIGPLLAAFVVAPRGQHSIAWFCLMALLAIVILGVVSRWYANRPRGAARSRAIRPHSLTNRQVTWCLFLLVVLMFSKFFYLASLNSYYTFYLIHTFGVSVQTSQICLFVFLAASAVGVFIGGPIGDRIGRKYVIWASILGTLPFSMALPHVGFWWTVALTIPIGLVLSSASSAIMVYAQELVPGKVGTISGMFFGLAFGLGGLGAAALGSLADATSIDFVYRVTAFLPLLGLLTALLPDIEGKRRQTMPSLKGRAG